MLAHRIARIPRPAFISRIAPLRVIPPGGHLRALSVSTLRKEGKGELHSFLLLRPLTLHVLVDQTLSSALQEELKYEQESTSNSAEVPEFLSKFKSSGVWQVSSSNEDEDEALSVHNFV